MTDKLSQDARPGEDQDLLTSRSRYTKMLTTMVLSVSIVAIVPLLVMTGINYHQYQEAFHSELTRTMVHFAASGKRSLESFLSERVSALAMAIRENSFEELQDPKKLNRLLVNLKQSFGGFIDLGVIDENGIQVSYAGPYQLTGRSYKDHDWFHEVSTRGIHISEVFLGYRHLPHFVIAVQQDPDVDREFVLRATIDTEVINRLASSLAVQQSSDAFIINRKGILQTPSRLYGGALERCPLPTLPLNAQAAFMESEDERGQRLNVSYAQVERSPFTIVLLSPRDLLHPGWVSLRGELLLFLAISIVLILAVTIFGSTFLVSRVRDADRKRSALFHKMEYTNKMAAIGRLGAGVAHEINNPLSIITEKAGLLKDLIMLSEEMPPREKLIGLVNSVLNSADRCGGITHRLLGFAKHMEVQQETIDLDQLLRDVLDFLGKEASYRGIQVVFNYPEEPPTVVSDRGQLQQVFLNIINNAFAAVEDGGRIEIGIQVVDGNSVAVSIADNGIGIPESQLAQIFDPFFTTKKGAGTGLGLSITYGIVQKLGGQISVKSKVGEGTCFSVTLPMNRASA